MHYAIAIGVGYLASLVLFPWIPGFWPDGGPLSARIEIALVLPTAAAFITLIVRRVWSSDAVRDASAEFEPTYGAITFAVVLFLIAIHLMLIGVLTGVLAGREVMVRATIALFGLMLVRVGNLLPRTRPNLALGIRTQATLADRRLWMQTHRIAGYIVVGLGLVFALGAAFR